MKALSVRQPFAWAIVAGFKLVENRDWPTRFRGRCLIHAAKKEERGDVDWVLRQCAKQSGKPLSVVDYAYRAQGQLGGIVGAVTITDCVEDMDSPWFFGRYGFVLADAVQCNFAPCRGRLSFFDVPLAVLNGGHQHQPPAQHPLLSFDSHRQGGDEGLSVHDGQSNSKGEQGK